MLALVCGKGLLPRFSVFRKDKGGDGGEVDIGCGALSVFVKPERIT